MHEGDPAGPAHPARHFRTTHWSVVLQAGASEGDSHAALESLCRSYWYPLHAYLRRRGCQPEEAKDLTQAFFLHLFQNDLIRRAQAERGRFRSFLLSTLQNFIANERRRERAQKRGGDATTIPLDATDAEERFALEPADLRTPEAQFERSWAFALIERVFTRLGEDYAKAGQADLFEALRPYLAGKAGMPGYAALGQGLGMSEGALAVAVHRMRRRYGELLREEIAQTVNTPREVEEELAHLLGVVASASS